MGRWRATADLSDPAVWSAAAEHAGVTGRAAMARRRTEALDGYLTRHGD